MKSLLLAPLLALTTCASHQVNVVDSCAVLKSALYSDGQFKFTESELKFISRLNKEKIVTVKKYYKENC